MAKSPLAVVSIIAPFIGGLIVPGSAAAQATKLHEQTTAQGEIDRTAYITHAEFQNISVGGGTVSGKSSSSRTTFKDMLSVASLKEVTRHFGEPISTEYNRFPEGISADYIVHIKYDGLNIKYRKRGKGIRLETMAITSEDRFMRVGGVKLQPGMNTDALSAVMRKAIEGAHDGIVGVKVARPGKSGDARSIRDTHTEIQIWTKKSTVSEVRFHRIAP